jgi:hypothetical protein
VRSILIILDLLFPTWRLVSAVLDVFVSSPLRFFSRLD